MFKYEMSPHRFMHLKTCLQLVAVWQGHGTLQKWRLPCDESLGMGLEVLLAQVYFLSPSASRLWVHCDEQASRSLLPPW